ncbi:MAG TPA: hypothetical protein VHA80_05595 [Solirubrobacterales bacterium]|nr:hypothetical protein [Solirubrobacterales bacterium]
MSDDRDREVRVAEQAVWIRRYLAPLVGARITEVVVFASGPYFCCRISAALADGGSVTLEVDRDEEGNGPGFLFGLPAPRPAADGSPAARLDWARRYLGPLRGCEVLAVGAEVYDGGAWPQITVRDGAGTTFALEVSCDEEGNAPGYLAGLERPGRPEGPGSPGSEVRGR